VASESAVSFERGTMGIGEGRRSGGTDDDWERRSQRSPGEPSRKLGEGEVARDHGRLRRGRHESEWYHRRSEEAVSQATG
jgi:hypothetical protein